MPECSRGACYAKLRAAGTSDSGKGEQDEAEPDLSQGRTGPVEPSGAVYSCERWP